MPRWTTRLSLLVVFSHPAIGTVGLTEDQAIKEYGQDNSSRFASTSRYKPSSRITLQTHHRFGADEKLAGLHADIEWMMPWFAVVSKHNMGKADLDAAAAIHQIASEEFVTMRDYRKRPSLYLQNRLLQNVTSSYKK